MGVTWDDTETKILRDEADRDHFIMRTIHSIRHHLTHPSIPIRFINHHKQGD